MPKNKKAMSVKRNTVRFEPYSDITKSGPLKGIRSLGCRIVFSNSKSKEAKELIEVLKTEMKWRRDLENEMEQQLFENGFTKDV